VSVIYSPGRFVFKGIYAEAFKDASYLQKYATSRERLLNNPTLQPERVKNLEGSAHVRFSKALSLSIAGYVANYSNAVGLAAATTPAGVATTQFQALGKQRIIGAQSEVRYDVKKLNVWGNFTYANPRDLSKEQGRKIPVSDIAPWSANLGVVYEKGSLAPQNYEVALAQYRAAAQQGHGAAANNLGVLYGNGRGVPRNYVEAAYWFSIAANAGNRNGANNRDAAFRRLQPAEAEQVRARLAAQPRTNSAS